MISAHRAATEIKLEQEKLPAVLLCLRSQGWEPAVLAAEQEFLRHAGIEPSEKSYRFAGGRLGQRGSVGDVFFKDGDMFFLDLGSPGRPGSEFDFVSVAAPDGESTLITGVVVNDGTRDAVDVWRPFADAVEVSIKSSVDGRRARYMRFDWTEIDNEPTGRLHEILSDTDEGPASFSRAQLDAALTTGAETLSSDFAREMLIEISKAGFVRATDLLAKWSRRLPEGEAEAAIESLKGCGLLATKHLLICRTDSSPLTEFDDPAELEAVKDLRHPSCNRRFADELLKEGYSVSPLGRSLIEKSHWMTVFVTERLVSAGVPADSIFWNMTEAGEEVDIVLSFLDEVWILELKDRDFGPGDAYPFNYRLARYSPQRAMIVTTGTVMADAKRVIAEMVREAGTPMFLGSRPRPIKPLYVEGLDAVLDAARRQVAVATMAHASSHVASLGPATGFDLRRVLRQRLR
ncbi:hypothetical protein FSW04_17920 [Baekduia soli]|uniref:Uncharacterized protein n=1 Tax=Baekduia soli TaxID=496014 RepID=A0A5B8U8E4_9ACTN|nr:hypothetical protein [Baekduia soli]QEC49270.1 hypothetical protein FSW04_17920 [Baekduia soli]